MAEITVSAIVLRRRDSGESDRRLTLLTREQGKIDAIAKGARKAGSRLAGSSDPLTVAQLGIATGRRNAFITQTQPVTSFPGLRTDYERLSFALALLELYSAVLPYEQPDPDAYELLLACLAAIEKHPKPVVALVWSELQLMSAEGFLPQFERSALSDTRIAEADPYVSPEAGGYVTREEAAGFSDRFKADAEVLLGLAKTVELDSPPANLKHAEQALVTLFRFWRHIAETQLPANEAVVNELRLKLSSR